MRIILTLIIYYASDISYSHTQTHTNMHTNAVMHIFLHFEGLGRVLGSIVEKIKAELK